MNGLIQVKDRDDILYDVNYDEDFQQFFIYEHDREDIKGNYFTSDDVRRFIATNQIEIVNDGNGVFKKYLV
jgi:hypothetical protein